MEVLINLLTVTEVQNCESLLGNPSVDGSPAYYISLIFSIIKYIALIMLIVLTIMDFVNAVASQDNDILKKSFNKAIVRMILCIILFLLPTLIDIILNFIHESSISNCINTNI